MDRAPHGHSAVSNGLWPKPLIARPSWAQHEHAKRYSLKSGPGCVHPDYELATASQLRNSRACRCSSCGRTRLPPHIPLRKITHAQPQPMDCSDILPPIEPAYGGRQRSPPTGLPAASVRGSQLKPPTTRRSLRLAALLRASPKKRHQI